MRRVIAAVLAVLLLAGCGAGEPVQTAPPTTAETLPLAPDFTVYDKDSNAYSLSDFRGKPVILNFWASWCGPCKAEMPDFEESYHQYGDRIHFVMVNLTDGRTETVESASKFIAQQGYTFPVYFDVTGAAADKYGISAIPCTYFIDARGHAVSMGEGMLDAESLQQGIDMILE